MIIKYKILKTDPLIHSIVVRYFTNELTEDFLAIDKLSGNIERVEDGSPTRCVTDYNFQIFEAPAPSGSALHKYIIDRAPVDYFNILNKINDPEVDTNMTDIQTNIGKTFEVEYVKPEVVSPTASKLETEAFMSEIDKLLEAIRTKD